MDNDEIKRAIREKLRVIYDGSTYTAQAWRVTWDDRFGGWRSSLELVKGSTLVIANAKECSLGRSRTPQRCAGPAKTASTPNGRYTP